MVTAAPVVNMVIIALTGHNSVEIGEMEKLARQENGNGIASVKAKEIDARNAINGHIGTHVQLGKVGKGLERGQSARTHAAHTEGNDAQPGLALECIQHKLRRDQRTQESRRERPVSKKQL